MGLNNHFRVLGGCIGVAICANILNGRITERLTGLIPPDMMNALLGSAHAISLLSPGLQDDVRAAFAASFSQQMQAVLGLRRQVVQPLLQWLD
jgi:hypothetical protein